MKPTRIALIALLCIGSIYARSPHDGNGVPMPAARQHGLGPIQGRGGPLPCADHSVTAAGVRSPQDVQAFVQCAYEYVQAMGVEEARRAFHEDARWRSGPIYVFVDEVAPVTGTARSLVYPPDASREGIPWGPLIDTFDSDILEEIHRVVNILGEGWVYYAFTDPTTGTEEPKISYVKEIDW